MTNKRLASALLAVSLIMVANITVDKDYDATPIQAINTDLMMLTVLSFNKVNEQVQECTHNSNCDK